MSEGKGEGNVREKSTETDRRRVGIFGGSFDPVHAGHIHLAKLARDAARLDEVRFLPCRISPHKTDRPPTPAERRLGWLRAATSGLPWAEVDETELKTEGPSYSYKTLEDLSRRFPESEWFWIMGGDQWNALPTWAEPEILARLATFIVLPRDGREVLPRDGYRMISVHGEHPASSTAIRQALSAGETEIPFLHPDVRKGL